MGVACPCRALPCLSHYRTSLLLALLHCVALMTLPGSSVDPSKLGLDTAIKPLLSHSNTGEFNAPSEFFTDAEKEAPKT
eukprot:4328749-Pyramimonas_sp.AAC.2